MTDVKVQRWQGMEFEQPLPLLRADEAMLNDRVHLGSIDLLADVLITGHAERPGGSVVLYFRRRDFSTDSVDVQPDFSFPWLGNECGCGGEFHACPPRVRSLDLRHSLRLNQEAERAANPETVEDLVSAAKGVSDKPQTYLIVAHLTTGPGVESPVYWLEEMIATQTSWHNRLELIDCAKSAVVMPLRKDSCGLGKKCRGDLHDDCWKAAPETDCPDHGRFSLEFYDKPEDPEPGYHPERKIRCRGGGCEWEYVLP